jgi:Uncharacterized conserved protein
MIESDENQRDDSREPIRLDQFLKFNGVTATGGEAKYLIQGGGVKVNGEIETRRKRQLKPGDRIEAHGQTLTVE